MGLITYLKERGASLYDLLAKYPARAFWLFVLAQMLLWTAIPALLFQNLPLDVIELLSWGHEWQFGYAKHPPGPAWILEALAVVSDRADWLAYFASQLAIAVTYWAIWRLGRETLGDMAALLAVLLTSLVYYNNLPTIEFNHNVLAIPLWALLGLYGWLALRDDRLFDWLLLGLFAGLSIYVKYSQALMVLTLIAFLVVFREARPRFKSPGLWLGVLVALLVALPHLFWMLATDFQSLSYATGRTRPLEGVTEHIAGPLKFLLAQLGALAGMALVILLGGAVLPSDRRRGEGPVRFEVKEEEARRYLLWIAFVPVLLAAFLSLVLSMKFRSMWGAPMLSFVALALMSVMKPFAFKERFGFMAASWALLHAGVLTALIIMATIGSHYAKKPLRTDYPGRDMGIWFSKLWQERTGTPLRFVDGNEWIAGNIAWYAVDRPSQIDSAARAARPWVDWRQVRCRGVLTVRDYSRQRDSRLPALSGSKEEGGKVLRGEQSFPWKLKGKPVRVGWAIVMPVKECKPAARK